LTPKSIAAASVTKAMLVLLRQADSLSLDEMSQDTAATDDCLDAIVISYHAFQ
jgi:hypothetical protein